MEVFHIEEFNNIRLYGNQAVINIFRLYLYIYFVKFKELKDSMLFSSSYQIENGSNFYKVP
jgi:hypothetical protein